MLRIATKRRGPLYTISLHGRIAGEWVALLDGYWQGVAEKTTPGQVTVVLSEVSFIGPEGEQLLERMGRHGVRFVASGCMNRHVVERVEGRLAAGPSRMI